MLRDQRTMLGPMPLESVEDVERAWAGYVGVPTETNREVHAYVSDGRWVADCLTPGCNGGMACWPEHRRACCLDCGFIHNVKFPTARTRAQAEEVLALRPVENQNWRPDQGEGVKMLIAENKMVGLA